MKRIVTDVSKQITRDSFVGLHARGSHIGVFDISGDLPVIRSAAYAVETAGDGHKSVVWLMRLGYDKSRPHNYMVIDHTTIRETMTQNEHGYVDQMPTEPWLGHGYFNMWWKHRHQVEKVVFGKWLDPIVDSYDRGRTPLNVNKLTGL